MIGRGALGNPQIFNPENKAKDVLGTILKHLSFMEEFFPAKYIVMNFRKHIPYYLKGFKGMKELKNELNAISDYERFKAKIIETFTR